MAISLTRASGLLLGPLLRTEAATQTDGILFECSIGLYTTGLTIGPNMTYADFTPADFVGYAALTAQTWGAAYLNQLNQLQLTSPLLQWTAGAILAPQIVRGYYVWRPGTPNVVILAEAFTDPITFSVLGDGLAFVVNVIFELTGHGNHIFFP